MQNRRIFIKNTALVIGALYSALLQPLLAYGSETEAQKKAMEARDVASVLTLLGVTNPSPGKRILLDVPEIMDANLSFRIKVSSEIPGTEWIAILADKNFYPLIGQFDVSSGKKVSTVEVNAKLPKTSVIRAVVRADNKFYVVTKEVKVTLGPCRK